MGTNPTAAILEGAKKVLTGANKFTASATKQAGNKVNPFVSKSQAQPTDYSHARTARKSNEAEPKTSGEDIAAGLESKKKNVEDYVKATAD